MMIAASILDSLETNFITGIIDTWITVMGPAFWVIVGLIIVIPMYNRLGIMPVAVIILSGVWIVFSQVLPGEALNVVMGIIIFAGASMITIVFFARRRPFG